jgi:8-oxo-dGTP pyrophosphatase MutT (NUDIX family)
MSDAKQYAALPYTVDAGRVRVMLITSRETKRWIIPKGWPKRDLKPYRLAELEAFEEAGLRGKISKDVVGQFTYQKLMDDGSQVQCDVIVYPLLVESQASNWPERDDRNCKWVKLSKAAKLVDDKGLAELLREFTPEDSKLKKSS